MARIFSSLTILFFSQCSFAQQPYYFFEGKMHDEKGKPVKAATIYVIKLDKTFTVDKKGQFSLSFPPGDYIIRFSSEEHKTKEVFLPLYRDTALTVVLESAYGGLLLDDVMVQARGINKVISPQADIETLDAKTVERLPSFLGEKDVIKSMQLLPGVVASSEGSAEMNVRGGSADQNLVLLDNIPLYNSSHLFGMHSAFNPLTVSKASLYKGAFPANYGGRVSSVMDVNLKEASMEEFKGSAELGITSAKAVLEIPLIYQKSSLLIAGRRSFYDALSNTFSKEQAIPLSFHDVNGIWAYNPSLKNQFRLSGYLEGDNISSVGRTGGFETAASKKNQQAVNFRWKHNSRNQLSNELNLLYNAYKTTLLEEKRKGEGENYLYNFTSSIRDVGINNKLTYLPSNNLDLFAGFEFLQHAFKPTLFTGDEENIPFSVKKFPDINATDLSFYISGALRFKQPGELTFALRNNNYLSPKKTYASIEPRISYFQPVGDQSSFKLSYSRMTQPIQKLSNAGLGLPLDLLISADEYIKPQTADMISAGFSKNFTLDGEQFNVNIEPYYKRLTNIISFRDGFDTRSVMYNSMYSIYTGSSYRDLVTSGKGNAYGLDLMLEKKTGRLNGWISYSLMQVKHQFDELNNGNAFFSNQDRRHSLNVVTNWQLNKKWNIGVTWMFISGQPANVPQDVYLPPGYNLQSGKVNSPSFINYYLFSQAGRGSYRMKPFHKLDITAEYKFKIGRMNAVWNIGAYNIYNRANPSFHYLDVSSGSTAQNGAPILKSVSLFPVMPSTSLTVNF